MPVIKPILSFTLFLLLRRGVLFFIREKIYMLKAPCSRNKHDFGRTFQKTVCRRPSGRQSCGASVAVQGRKRGRTRRFHRTSRGGIRGAEVSRLRSGRWSFDVAGFGELRADLRRFAVETRVRHLERGDVRRRGTGVQQEMKKTRKSGARRRACGANLRRLRSPWPCPSATAEGGFVGA